MFATTVTNNPVLALFLLAGSATFLYNGYFLGLTRGRIPRSSILVSTPLVFLPLAPLTRSPRSNTRLWSALAARMVTRGLTLA